MSVSLHSKGAAAAALAEGQFLLLQKNWLKFAILQDGIVRRILSSDEEKNLYPKKKNLNENRASVCCLLTCKVQGGSNMTGTDCV